MIFKYILIISLSLFFLYVLLIPRETAIRKIFLLCIVITMIIFSFFPNISTGFSNVFGIGRGADFLFYISHLVLFFMVFLLYLKNMKMEEKLTKIVRYIAIKEVLD